MTALVMKLAAEVEEVDLGDGLVEEVAAEALEFFDGVGGEALEGGGGGGEVVRGWVRMRGCC